MAMGKHDPQKQQPLFIVAADLPRTPAHPFYEALNQVLGREGFDPFVEGLCQKFYAEVMGRPSLEPGKYFRLLLLGYFEGIDAERGIAWRCGDSLSLRDFVGYALNEAVTDHSTISRTRRLIDLETHQEVFRWVLTLLGREGLVKGKTVGVDASTLEANAAMKSIVRKDNGQGYDDFLKKLAEASGIQTPTREDLAKIDKKRKNKASNDDWHNPFDPDARIAKMKDGRTHLAHRQEHAVDMDSGAVVGVTILPADEGDTTAWRDTVEETYQNLNAVAEDAKAAEKMHANPVEELVADKGYHSNQTMTDYRELGIRSYVSEPRRGGRKWEGKAQERAAVYANRRRMRGRRGRRLMRKRGELIERSFAHVLETGAMRRTHLKRHHNILKRMLVHVGGFNLGLLMRKVFGVGKPRCLQGLANPVFGLILTLWNALAGLWRGASESEDVQQHFWPRRLAA